VTWSSVGILLSTLGTLACLIQITACRVEIQRVRELMQGEIAEVLNVNGQDYRFSGETTFGRWWLKEHNSKGSDQP
jgi:hypothetical protein